MHFPQYLTSVPVPPVNRASLIGVGVAVAGNVLISIALNCQKLAHIRLEREEQTRWSLEDEQDALDDGEGGNGNPHDESSPLLHPYKSGSNGDAYVQIDGEEEEDPDAQDNDDWQDFHEPGTEFLKSKLWWLGIALMIIGEAGNFLSYGFAPASLVAPLGAVALLSNVIISPLMLGDGERFTLADLGGILLATIGAVTVVFSSKQDDARLGPHALLQAIKRVEFIVYASIAMGAAAGLIALSKTRVGDRYVLVDVGVCAIFGGFTVLSTKGLSSLLSYGNPFDVIRYPITYVLIVVLAGTAVAQITFLNRALQRFESRKVIPTQFVFFTISAIVGSAVLYRDFESVEVHRLINFLFGCLTTFAGVFVLTRSKGTPEGDYEEEDDDGSTRHRRKRSSRHHRSRSGKLSNVQEGSASEPDSPHASRTTLALPVLDEESHSNTTSADEDDPQTPKRATRVQIPHRPSSSSSSRYGSTGRPHTRRRPPVQPITGVVLTTGSIPLAGAAGFSASPSRRAGAGAGPSRSYAGHPSSLPTAQSQHLAIGLRTPQQQQQRLSLAGPILTSGAGWGIPTSGGGSRPAPASLAAGHHLLLATSSGTVIPLAVSPSLTQAGLVPGSRARTSSSPARGASVAPSSASANASSPEVTRRRSRILSSRSVRTLGGGQHARRESGGSVGASTTESEGQGEEEEGSVRGAGSVRREGGDAEEQDQSRADTR